MKSLSFIVAVSALFLTTSPAWAEGNSIKGHVVDVSGRAIEGAQVRAQRADGKGKSFVATTNAKGEYSMSHLDAANYKLVASIKKTPKSAANIATSPAGWAKVDFVIRDIYQGKVRQDQSAMERVKGQDMRETINHGISGH